MDVFEQEAIKKAKNMSGEELKKAKTESDNLRKDMKEKESRITAQLA